MKNKSKVKKHREKKKWHLRPHTKNPYLELFAGAKTLSGTPGKTRLHRS